MRNNFGWKWLYKIEYGKDNFKIGWFNLKSNNIRLFI